MGNQLTAICFLVDERVYDKIKYPDFNYEGFNDEPEIYKDIALEQWKENIGNSQNLFLRNFLQTLKLA